MIDIATFRLVAEAEVDAFVAADAAYQAGFAYQQGGIQRRTLARGADGGWLALTLWDSEDAAYAAAAAESNEPLATARAAFIDESTVEHARFDDLPG